MKITMTKKNEATILRTAEHFGQTPEEIRKEIQACIDAAWRSSDPSALILQKTLFPDGAPSPEQFISVIAAYLMDTGKT